MNEGQIELAANILWNAAKEQKTVAPLSDMFPNMSGEDAYAVQSYNTDRRLKSGTRLVGRKVGLTARSVQKQLGVSQPDFGALFDDMSIADGEPVSWSQILQPKVEAEIALVIERDLLEPGISSAQLLRSVAFVLPAIEIVGSRIADWNIRFVDTVADNASSGAFVLGNTPISLKGLDLRLAGMVMERAGEQVSLGAGAACLGNPLNAALWLANKMATLGQGLVAGDIVLTGALGPMVTARPGDIFETRIEGIGSVRAVFGEEQ